MLRGYGIRQLQTGEWEHPSLSGMYITRISGVTGDMQIVVKPAYWHSACHEYS